MEFDSGATWQNESRTARTGGWREAFLNRHRRAGADIESEDLASCSRSRAGLSSRGTGARSLSRTRASSRTSASENADSLFSEAFDQKAILEQDRALIEQLTQRPQRREGAALPKRTFSIGREPKGEAKLVSSPGRPTLTACARAASEIVATTTVTESRRTTATEIATAADTTITSDTTSTAYTEEITTAVSPRAPSSPLAVPGKDVDAAKTMEPVVPRTGALFTAADIDNIMDRFGDSGVKEAAPFSLKPQLAPTSDCTQNFGDISQEFYRNHRIENPQKKAEPVEVVPEGQAFDSDTFQVPQRRALKQQIQAIDSWLEDDFTARERLGNPPSTGSRIDAVFPSPKVYQDSALTGLGSGQSAAEADIFKKLEDVKRRKDLGERVSPVTIKEIATQVKPLLPEMRLEQLVRTLRLFTSARYEDHDLYLRILGEIPVQVRGISPEMLTTCLRVLWRLRLYEETYLELFSMEAMNMIRAARKPTARAPRRPPAPSRAVDPAAAVGVTGSVLLPTPPPAPSPAEAPTPFNATQLIHIGNALSQLGAKHPARFLEVFQEQLSIAIPRMTQEECELVSLAFASSQLMHDPLRRAFLERCSQVDAGAPVPSGCVHTVGAAPDIARYQQEAEIKRRRLKNFRNIFLIEASIRKETFSFFSSLPAEVRSYLDKVHSAAANLQHEGNGSFALQVAAVLDQLGVACDLKRLAGPVSLHIVAKATNPRAEFSEVVYECNDFGAYFAPRQDDRNAPHLLTTPARLRQKLLQRMGIQLVQLSIWEWQQMSEAQRINYMVKLQSS
jgi:hypothetical protein